MRRRDFLGALGGATTWPLAAHAQLPNKPPIIGFLGTTSQAVQSAWVATFLQRLRELGWVEGRTVVIDFLWSEGGQERIEEIAGEFVRRNVDVIVTTGTGVAALKRATSTIPIVFAVAVDPIGSGFVASLARPGGNATGLSIQSRDVVGKRIELLREIVVGMRRLAIVANADYPIAMQEMSEAQAAATALGLDVVTAGMRRTDDIAIAFESIKGRADALYVVGEAFVNINRVRIVTFALSLRLPMISAFREITEAGGLVTYGASYHAMFRRSADFVDKILRGAKPSDIPVEQPTKFDLAINLTTAKALGLTVPPTVLARADEVIE
jgi:putative ABC transport system substrate-binding protein